jgi:CubicO group peptidase (beta-lactamase class C family)
MIFSGKKISNRFVYILLKGQNISNIDLIMKTRWIIALYLLVISSGGIMLFKDIIFKEKEPVAFEDFVDKEVPILMKKRGVTGANIAIIRNGKVSQIKNYGFADRKNNIPITKETRFRVASVSKVLTAWGVLNLVEEGLLDLERPVEDYLSRWKFPESEYDSKEVTVRRLLTHTAGVSVSYYGGYSPNKKRTSLIESLEGENVAHGPVQLIAAPGTVKRYSGGGYTVLQLLIEEITGMPFDKYMEEEIIMPLGLRNYAYTYDPLSDVPQLALPYGRNGKPLPIYLYTEKAAGGFMCSIEDLSLFLLSFINDQTVLSGETIDAMIDKDRIQITGILENEISKHIGFGGTTLGYSADVWLDLTTQDGYASMYNSTNGVYLGADIANQWLQEHASTPDPTLMILNLEFYGIRLAAYILGIVCFVIGHRRYRMFRLKREHYSFRWKKKYSELRLIYALLILSVIVFWWISFHTLIFYPPIQIPWLPDSFIYLSIFSTIILAHSAFKTLFISKSLKPSPQEL